VQKPNFLNKQHAGQSFSARWEFYITSLIKQGDNVRDLCLLYKGSIQLTVSRYNLGWKSENTEQK